MSRAHPGRFWTLNDSGNPPELFLADTTATITGSVRVLGATNIDWEAVSLGPCGSETCVYIGDIGDNRAVRRSVVIYRVVEPTDRDLTQQRIRVKDSLVVRYGDQPHDAEAMVVSREGEVAIFT